MTAAQPRPRIVDVAFWAWLTGAVLLIIGGLLSATTTFGTVRGRAPAKVTDDQIHTFLSYYRGVGVLCVLLGLAIGYLAGQARRGDKRFRRAAVTLSLVVVVSLLACAVLRVPSHPMALLGALALIVAAGLATRAPASAWFDAVEQPGGDDD